MKTLLPRLVMAGGPFRYSLRHSTGGADCFGVVQVTDTYKHSIAWLHERGPFLCGSLEGIVRGVIL